MFFMNSPPSKLQRTNTLHIPYAYIGLLCLFLSWIAMILTVSTSNPVSSFTSLRVLVLIVSNTSHQPPGNAQVPFFSCVSNILLSLNVNSLLIRSHLHHLLLPNYAIGNKSNH